MTIWMIACCLKMAEIKKHATSETANHLYKVGADYYISKPADFGELKKILQRAISLVSHIKGQPIKENFYINQFKSAC